MIATLHSLDPEVQDILDGLNTTLAAANEDARFAEATPWLRDLPTGPLGDVTDVMHRLSLIAKVRTILLDETNAQAVTWATRWMTLYRPNLARIAISQTRRSLDDLAEDQRD